MDVSFQTQYSSPMTRREFLVAAAGSVCVLAGLNGCSTVRNSQPANLVGSGLYGWTQYYSREGRNANDHMDEVLSAVRDCGYAFLEGFIDLQHPEKCARLAEQSRAKGLKPVSIYVTAPMHEQAKAENSVARLVDAARICRQSGFSIINLNPAPIGRAKTDQELRTQIEALEKLGTELSKLGLKLGIHNHTPEMVNGAKEFHYDLRETNPRHVGFCFDVHWVFRGGIKPLDCLHEYGSRVVSWHLRQSRDGTWWENLDDGDVDYPAVAAFARQHRMTAPYAVELALENGTKITRSVVENHRRSREYVRTVFGC